MEAFGRALAAMAIACALAIPAGADVITITGPITQSTTDGTGPSINNLTLNNISDGDMYTVNLSFKGVIGSPGTYDLTAGTLVFSDAAASATENNFASIGLVILGNAGFLDLSLKGCLATGSFCDGGNELTANFEIPAGSLHAQNVAASELDQPHPLDLLEDDGITDIHGSIGTYSYISVHTVPEPGTALLLGCSLLAMALRRVNS